MRQFNIHEAKRRLSEIVAAVEQGEEIVIARRGKPVARLSAWVAPASARRVVLGGLEGMVREIDPDWWKPIPDEDIREWFGDKYADEVGAP